MFGQAHPHHNQCTRRGSSGHQCCALVNHFGQLQSRKTPTRADQDAQYDGIFEDVLESNQKLLPVNLAARASELHASRSTCPQQQHVEDNQQRDRRHRGRTETCLHNGHTELHVVAENAAHARDDTSRGILLKKLTAQKVADDVYHHAGPEKGDQYLPIHRRAVGTVAHQVKEHHRHQELEDKLRKRLRYAVAEHADFHKRPA